MILKGSQRGNGADLAVHLMNSFDNERIEIAEVYGAVASDLFGAFAEFEAVAAGTKAKQYLYSLSVNPSAPLTREQYLDAIGTIEHRLGLTDQPRAMVFHVKDGREHCHVVWSRIDVDEMRAVHMAHDRLKLMDLACQLAEEYGLDLPPGLKAWEEKQKREKDKLEPSLAEKAQAEHTGISPEQRREEITAAYERSDSAETFRRALEEKGYILAKGDRRGLVVVDQFGGVHSLTRYVEGHTAKQIKGRLASLTPDELPSVDQAKEIMRQRVQAQQDIEREQDLAEARKANEEALATRHATRRLEVQQAEQELVTRQQAERLALHAAQKSESERFLFRVRVTVADLVRRTPGLRSVLGHIQKLTNLDPGERQRLEREALDRRHTREKRDFERRKRVLARLETRERQSLEKALRKEQQLKEELRLKAAQARPAAVKARQDFSRPRAIWACGAAGILKKVSCHRLLMTRPGSAKGRKGQAARTISAHRAGSRGPRNACVAIGGNAERVTDIAETPEQMGKARSMFKTIVVPTDGSENAQMAVEFGADLAAKYAARLVLLHVGFCGGDVPQGLEERAEREFEQARRAGKLASEHRGKRCRTQGPARNRCALRLTLWGAVAIGDDRLQTSAILGRDQWTDDLSHAASIAHPPARLNPLFASVH